MRWGIRVDCGFSHKMGFSVQAFLLSMSGLMVGDKRTFKHAIVGVIFKTLFDDGLLYSLISHTGFSFANKGFAVSLTSIALIVLTEWTFWLLILFLMRWIDIPIDHVVSIFELNSGFELLQYGCKLLLTNQLWKSINAKLYRRVKSSIKK